MPRKATPVKGAFEREKSSGLWRARVIISGKLIRVFFERNRLAAINLLDKARTRRLFCERIVPDLAKRPVMTTPELETRAE